MIYSVICNLKKSLNLNVRSVNGGDGAKAVILVQIGGAKNFNALLSIKLFLY
jgi:hypothetical protein